MTEMRDKGHNLLLKISAIIILLIFFISAPTLAAEIIIDNDAPETSYAGGEWGYSSGADPYGGSSRTEMLNGATYTFESQIKGYQTVSLWWTYWGSRCQTVPVAIYDGDTLLDTVYVDQQQQSLAGQWNILGSYSFIDNAKVVIRAQAGCSACADAVRFVSTVAPELSYIEISGPVSVNENTSVDYTCTAHYTDGSSREVEPDWSENSSYASISATGLLTTGEVGGSQACTITATYEEGGIEGQDTLAVTIQDYVPPTELIIDNGDSGTSFTGAWYESGGVPPIGADNLYSKVPGSIYRYAASLDGYYEVYLYWTYWSSRCTNVPVRIYDGDELVYSTTVNQQQNGGAWNRIGPAGYLLNGSVRVEVQATSTSCSTCADAVRFVSTVAPELSYIEISGPVSVNENTSVDYTCTAHYTDGSSREVEPDWSENSSYASISATGLLTTGEVGGSQACTITATYEEGGIAKVDDLAILIEDYVPPVESIIDNDDPGTSYAGGDWGYSSGANPYDGSSRAENTSGATYTFQKTMSGSQSVSLWWTYWTSRCSAVPIDIYDGNTLLDTKLVNQHQLSLAGQWNVLGTYTFNGTARVVIRAQSGCSACADAVKFQSTGPVMVSVPDVVGQAQAVAESMIIAVDGLSVGVVTTASSDTVPTGVVISQNPPGSSSAIYGSAVDLVVSSGPVMVLVPDVVGQAQAAAEATINAVDGLSVGAVTTASSDTVPAGVVISQDPPGSSSAIYGSAVDLVVSSGSLMVLVPDVVGQAQAAAEATINAVDGLSVGAVTTASSDTVPVGVVISQDPGGGSFVDYGSSVDLLVSEGPAPVTVPDVVGYADTAAISAINDEGLAASVSHAYSDTVASGLVISQDPSGGTSVIPGSTVNIVVSLGTEPTGLVTDTDFETSSDSADLRADGSGRDWYESRGQDPVLLFLDEGDIGGNTDKKAGFSASNTTNAYMSQAFEPAQTGKFALQWDIYMDEILDISAPDRAGWMLIGDDSVVTTPGPNSDNDERFVYMAFAKDGGGTSGSMDLVARDRNDGWTSFTTVASGLILDQWYTITVVCDLDADTYDVFVDGVYQATLTSRIAKDTLTHISFAQWNDGAGAFYVDNVKDVALGAVPECADAAQASAESLITGAGLIIGTVSLQYDDTIVAGNVISTTPAGGTVVPVGSTVDLLVSDGPAPVTVPDVVGYTDTAAISAINDEGLAASVSHAYSDTVASGLVISQDPSGGTGVIPGSTVNIVVSLGAEPTDLIVDSDFEASGSGGADPSADLRYDDPAIRDWYESRGDIPTLVFLDDTNIGGNTTQKAGFAGSESGNAYLSQELSSPQTGIFSIQWDIYIENILDLSTNPDRAGWVLIGDDSSTSSSDANKGPNSTGSERFVYMALYKDGGGDTGTMDLVAREPGQDWDGGSFTKVAGGLSLNQWYTIKVTCDVPNNTYMVYVDGAYQKTLTAFTGKDSLTHVSFATWNDGAGDFYVDNVMEVESVLHTLTVNSSDHGSVNLFPPGGIYPDGSEVTLYPVPDAGWAFQEWDGDLLGGANPATINMDSNKVITPIFIAAPEVALHLFPTLLDFGNNTDVLTIDIKNNGDVPFDWMALADQPWVVDINPSSSSSSGALGSGESVILTVTVDRDLIGTALPDTNCRMWGAISNTGIPTDVLNNDLIEANDSLKNLTQTYNEEGWGIGYYATFGDTPEIVRGPVQAYYDDEYNPAVNAIAAAKPNITVAHVRNCTSGCCNSLGQEIDDPHPFYRQKNGKTWLFMHNGSINKTTLRNLIGEDYLTENPPNGSGIPLCDPDDPDLVVDSELYFLLVLKNIEAKNWSIEQGIIQTVEQLGSISSINFIMTDGYGVWGFRKGQDLAYYHNATLGYSAVASQPPDGSGSGWTVMSDNELVILRPMATPEVINVIDFSDTKQIATIQVETSLGESASVQIAVDGPDKVLVPDVAGMSLSAAETAITSVGLTVGNIAYRFSPTTSPGNVIIQSNIAGSQLLEGAAVDLVVCQAAVINDNGDPDPVGNWQPSSGPNPYGGESLYVSNDGTASYTWTFTPSVSGYYNVAMWWTALSSRGTNIPVDIRHSNDTTTVYINQQENGGQWNSLGSYYYQTGNTYEVTLRAVGGGASNCADAVRFTKENILRHKFTVDLPGGDQMMPVMGDIDDDGVQEIVVVAGYYVVAINGETGEIEWTVSGAAYTAPELVDLDNDGVPEILHGMNDSNGPRLRALNGDGTMRWTSAYLPGDEQALFAIVAYDIDGDGLPTIFFATEDYEPDPYSGNIDDYNGALVKLDHNGNVLDSTWILKPCWGGLALGDANFDGAFEVYIGDRREGYHDLPGNGMQAFDAHTLSLLWERPDIHHSSPLPILADVTGDSNLEVVASKITLAGPMVLNSATGATISDYSNRRLPTHGTPTVYDIDEDGNLEVIYSTSYPETAPSNFVVFDLISGEIDFEASFDFWITWPPTVGDVTGDGHMEILVATGSQTDSVGDTHNGNYPILVYDKAYKLIDIVELNINAGQLTPARVFDTDNDGQNEVVVPGFNNKIMVYDTSAATPNPAPNTWVQLYSIYRQGVPEYVAPPPALPSARIVTPVLSDSSDKIVDYHEEVPFTEEPSDAKGYSGFE